MRLNNTASFELVSAVAQHLYESSTGLPTVWEATYVDAADALMDVLSLWSAGDDE